MLFDFDLNEFLSHDFVRVLDEYVQYVAVLIVYRFEYLILPLVGALVIALRPIGWLAPLRWPLLIGLLLFLVVFEMHWYSALALPIVALILFWDAARDLWSVVLGARAPRPPSRDQLPPASGEAGGIVYWVALVAVFGLILAVGQARWDLILILAVIVLATLVAIYARPWHRMFEGMMERRLRSEPRMQTFLDTFRWLRARQSAAHRPYLAANRMADGDNSRVAQLKSYRFVRLLRRLLPKIWMPTIASSLSIQLIARARKRAWSTLEAELSLRTDLGAAAHLEPEVIGCRHRWLAHTEALAECFAFSNEHDARVGETTCNWVYAGELLFHAAEVQFEVIRDLADLEVSGHMDALEDGTGSGADALAHESQLLLHFSEIAIGATERILDINADRYADLTLPERFSRYTRKFGNSEDSDADLDGSQDLWRSVIALRYQLLQALRQTLGDMTAAPFDGKLDVQFDAQGMGFVAATVNGLQTRMLYDSGASQTVLTYELAKENGLDPDDLIFNVTVMTANGLAKMAYMRLDRFEVGGQVFRDFPIFVAQPEMLFQPLLGMDIIKLFSPGHPGAFGAAYDDQQDPVQAFEPGPMLIDDAFRDDGTDAEFLAQCARDGAEALNLMVAGLGAASPRRMLATSGISHDLLEQADLRIAEARTKDYVFPSMQALAEDAALRALHLHAMCIEQDLRVLSAGSAIWQDRLETAADFHIYTQSYRLHRLAHLQEVWAGQATREIVTC